MVNRSISLVPLLAGALLAGCAGPEESSTESDGVVPAGAIPAAPDVRPGMQPAPGAAQPTAQAGGAAGGGATDTAGAAAAAAPDTAR